MSDLVHYGPWINWSRGTVNGATITLTPRNAAILVGSLAIFVSLAGTSLWKILAYTVHQMRVAESPRDGLHYQQQVILRNTETPGAATWQLIWLGSSWRKLVKRPFWRSAPIALLAFTTLSLFSGIGVLVGGLIRTTGKEVLISSPECGNWTINVESPGGMDAFVAKGLNDTMRASNYARTCYSGSSNALECNHHKRRSLPYQKTVNVSCPVDEAMCLQGFPAFSLDTGNLSSHDHLGINTRIEDRIFYRRKTTCAPIVQEGFIVLLKVRTPTGQFNESSDTGGDWVQVHYYGGRFQDGGMWVNYTHIYNHRQRDVDNSYTLSSYSFHSDEGDDAAWVPDPSIRPQNGVLSLMFLSANGLAYSSKVDDPIFRTLQTPSSEFAFSGYNRSFYGAESYVKVHACVDQHQFCNPINHKCTDLDSSYSAATSARDNLGLNSMQYGIISTLATEMIPVTSISQCIGGRGRSALRAQEKVTNWYSGSLPSNQWQIEVESWFTTGLSKIQYALVEHASGPENMPETMNISKPIDEPSRRLCASQMMQAPPGSGAVSFSTLGVALTFGLGGLIILINIGLLCFQSTSDKNEKYRLTRWALDDKLQLQRHAFQGAGMGTWKEGFGVPITTSRELFAMKLLGAKMKEQQERRSEEEETLAMLGGEAFSASAKDVSRELSVRSY